MSDPVRAIVRRFEHRCRPHAGIALAGRSSTPWQSLLFDGDRHRFDMVVSGQDVDAAIAAITSDIADDEVTIPGHLVAEIRLATIDHGPAEPVLTIEALTIRS